ncbi:MAG TPA: hypothetical protein DF383_03830 [Deltaproteobacteria bacterium]|nr:hypothetical protein [Deltaproteobacteria bacterium]
MKKLRKDKEVAHLGQNLTITPAQENGDWKDLQFKPTKKNIDVVQLLREDRDGRDDFLYEMCLQFLNSKP